MSKWFGKSAEININIPNPPLNFKYSPLDPKVSGNIDVKFLQDVSKITNIRCGLAGTADILHYVSEVEFGGLQAGGLNRRLISETVNFFNTFIDLPLKCDDSSSSENLYSFKSGDKLETNFTLEFPEYIYLPSSCKNFGTVNGDVTISYEVYVEINKSSKILLGNPKRLLLYKIPIGYQSGKDPLLIQNAINLQYVGVQNFKDKVKKFYFDNNTNALIPTSLEKPHSKTKFIRQLWNNDYKSENYTNITKTIPLRVDFSTQSIFNLAEPLGNQFALTLVSDLKSVGINDNQGTDFVYNSQSTKLGLFQIESLLIQSDHDITMKCYQYIIREQCRETVIKIDLEDLFVDVKDFTYDKENGVYKYDVSNEELTKAASVDLTKPLLELMEYHSIMTTGSLSTWFRHEVKLNFTLKISDGSSQRKKYTFTTSATPDVPTGVHAPCAGNGNVTDVDASGFVPPPTYEMSKGAAGLVEYEDLEDVKS